MALCYDVCVYILHDHPAIFWRQTGQSLQRPCGDRAETIQSLCNLNDLGTKIVYYPCNVLAGSLRLSQEPTISFLAQMTIKNGVASSRSGCGARTGIV